MAAVTFTFVDETDAAMDKLYPAALAVQIYCLYPHCPVIRIMLILNPQKSLNLKRRDKCLSPYVKKYTE